MEDSADEDFDATRAALAPTLEAAAAVLPWLSTPKPARFDDKLNQRWISACNKLKTVWGERYEVGEEGLRPAIFSLYGIALETADGDCLHLGEALASYADHLEAAPATPTMIAALSATIETLCEPAGLEHLAFPERARHFTQRLESAITSSNTENPRSSVLDQLFVGEALERIELMQDALAALPPDAYALKIEALAIATQAEHLALYGIMHLAKQLASKINTDTDLDSPTTRQAVETLLAALNEAIAAVPP